MTPEVRINAQFDRTNLETGWDESGQNWRALHFSGHTVREHEGGFPADYRIDISLSDTPGYIEVPWIKGDFGGVVFFYPDDDPAADPPGVVSCQIHVPGSLFTDCLRLSTRLQTNDVPVVATISSTQIGGDRKGERVLAFSMADRSARG